MNEEPVTPPEPEEEGPPPEYERLKEEPGCDCHDSLSTVGKVSAVAAILLAVVGVFAIGTFILTSLHSTSNNPQGWVKGGYHSYYYSPKADGKVCGNVRSYEDKAPFDAWVFTQPPDKDDDGVYSYQQARSGPVTWQKSADQYTTLETAKTAIEALCK